MADVAVLVPRRADGGRRDELWEWARGWWIEHLDPLGWPIFEGHHDEGRFNRSAAVNAAAEAAGDDWSAAVILDADVVLRDIAQLVRAVKVAKASGRMTFSQDQWCGLTDDGTRRIIGTGPLGPGCSWNRWVERRNWFTFSCSVVVPRRLWDNLGGMDERFRGWGCEDGAFHVAARLLGGGSERVPGELFHLWHPRSEEREHGHPDYQANFALRDRYELVRHDLDGMRALLAEPGAPRSAA